MMKILSGTIFLVFLIIFFMWGDFFLPIRHALLPSFFNIPSESVLKEESASLRIELEKLLSLKDKVSHFAPETVSAEVYSNYPFNDKGLLVITAGTRSGLKPKMAVVADGLLIGRIEEVHEYLSLVKTIFDSSFELSVKIGATGVNSLFKGGPNPQVSLISKDIDVKPGAGVISANKDLPYGLPVGEIADIHDESGEIWRTASLRIPYDPENLGAVSVITNFSY
jgi:cell shape-determining protein MreC